MCNLRSDMTIEEHYRKLEHMYLHAKMHQQVYTGLRLNIEAGKATVEYTVDDRVHHAAGAMHGAVYFKLLDDAAYFAVASEVREVFVLTKQFNVDLIRPHVEGKITSVGKIVERPSEYAFIAEAELKNAFGKVLGIGRGEFVKGRSPLTPEIGYA